MGWITDQVLLAGAGISPENWPELVQMGIGAVVNLRAERQDDFTDPLPRAYLWLPTADHQDPTPEQLLVGAQFIDTAVKAGEKVLVHCQMGIHRSATLVVAYLIYGGLSKEEAIWKLAQNGPRLYGSDENHRRLDQFMALLAAVKKAA